MSIHTVSAQIALPWTLELMAVLRVTLAISVLAVLWPHNRLRPLDESSPGPYLLASASLMVSYWVLAGVVLVALHLLNFVTILAMALLPRLAGRRYVHSRYQLRWDVQLFVAGLDAMAHPSLLLHSLKAYLVNLKTLRHPWSKRWQKPSLISAVAFIGVLAVSLWLRLATVFANAAPAYRNGLQNMDWTNALAHNRWMVGGHPIPLGSFMLLAEISRVDFVNPLMLEKLAASLVFLATASGLAAVTWSMSRSMAASLAAITAFGVFPNWLPIPLVRELAVGPAALGMMGVIPTFWLMYQAMRTGHRVYGAASLALVLLAGVTNFDAGIWTAAAALIAWIAAWISHHIPVSRGLGWLASLWMAWMASSIPMLLQRLLSHQWALTSTMFPLPSSALHAPQLSLFELELVAGVLAWALIRIWIEDYGVAVGVLLLLVLALCLQEAPVFIPLHIALSGTRQLLALVESLSISGMVSLLLQDLVTVSQSLGIGLVSLAGLGLGLFTSIQPLTTYTMRSDSYFYAYEMIGRMYQPYSWLAVSNGGSSLAEGEGYHMDPLQWTTHVNPRPTHLRYQSHHHTARPIAQHQIFFFIEHHIHATPLPNNEFTVLRERIRNHDLHVWLAEWQALHSRQETMAVFFQSPELTVYRLQQ